MDISKYISEFLFEHDCVIIPGFGGFVCNYKSAEIHPVMNTISPPSKAISFNKNLRTNDGLLLNYIATRDGISFDEAFASVYAWVGSANGLLQRGEDVILKKIGKFHNDIEGNLQFIPDESVNYLKSSFGLKTITAEPILHGKTINLKERRKEETIEVKPPRNVWRIAAAIFLVAALVSLIQLMQMGVEIKPLHLDEANVLSFVNSIFKTAEPELKTIPVETANPGAITEPLKEEIVPVEMEAVAPATERYYIIIGSFSKNKNIASARKLLLENHDETEVLVEKGDQLTRVGYLAGVDLLYANEQLKTEQERGVSCWLLKK